MRYYWEHLATDDGRMRVYIAAPDSAGAFPGVVVIHNRGGVHDILEVAGKIASAGYVAAAPDMYYRDGMDCQDDGPTRRARLRDATVIKDANAVAAFLKVHKATKDQPLGILGFCMGGRVTYLMAAANPGFKAAVMYYGGGIFVPWGMAPPLSPALRRFTARSWAILEKRTKTLLLKICADSTAGSRNTTRLMSSILMPEQATPL